MPGAIVDTGPIAEPLARTRARTGPTAVDSGRVAVARVSSVSVAILVGSITLLLSLPFVTHLQADSYKALYDARWIVEHGLPHTEALTVMAAGRPWIDQQWLAEVIFYGAWRIGGYSLLAGLAIALTALAYTVLAATMSRRGASPGLVLCSATMAILSLSGWQFIRSQNFALPLFAGLMAICLRDSEQDRPGRRLLLLLPLLVLWANLHGSVLLGAALAVAYLSYRATLLARQKLYREAVKCAALGVAAVGSPLATPYGTQIVDYYARFAGNRPMAQLAIEWASPRFPSFVFFELALPAAIVVAALVSALVRRERPSAVLIGAFTLTGIAASLESGSIVWFGMVAALLLAEIGRRRGRGASCSRPASALIGISGALAAAFAATTLAARPGQAYESIAATHAMAAARKYVATHPCASILADNLSSSALLWHYPSLDGRLAFDARLEEYSQPALRDWLAFVDAKPGRWRALADRFSVVVADPSYASALIPALARFPASRVLARDTSGIAVLTGGRVHCSAAVRINS